MKKTILVVILMTSAAFAFAYQDQTITQAEKNITNSIQNQIKFPEFLREQEGEYTAVISFSITENGSIKIKHIECNDVNLKSDLLDQGGNIKINTVGLDTRDTYRVVVHFKTE